MIIDPDKLVEKEKKIVLSVYQSEGHPKHFENEGQEFIDQTSNEINTMNTLADALNLSIIFPPDANRTEKT